MYDTDELDAVTRLTALADSCGADLVFDGSDGAWVIHAQLGIDYLTLGSSTDLTTAATSSLSVLLQGLRLG